MVVLIIDHTELSWCHPVDFFFRVDHERMIVAPRQRRLMVFWGMANLKRDVHWVYRDGEEMEILPVKVKCISWNYNT